jgi:DNA polymerase-3 subunit gamma/tau
MTTQALYRKWRSQTFNEVVGQEHVTTTLLGALKLGRVAHAYLFSGPRGTGKTSTARLLAKAVNCLADDVAARPCNQCRICRAVNEGRLLDLVEIDAASNTGVDDIRDLRDKIGFRPGEARTKFYIIDEVHMLSNSAFNALLKTLEEPPGHVIFVLATTEPEKIPATITSRCQRFEFKRIKVSDVAGWLGHIVAEEGLQAEPEALAYIARQGGGSMRDAISLLDQLTAYGQEKITLELVRSVLGAVTSQAVVELIEATLKRDAAAGLDAINRLVGEGVEPRQLAREAVEYLRGLMLVKLGNGPELLDLPAETLQRMQVQAAGVDARTIIRATDRFNQALFDLKSSLLAIPQLPLELAFVEAITLPPVVGPVQAIAPAVLAPPAEPLPELPSLPPAEGLSREVVERCVLRVAQAIEGKNKTMAVALQHNARFYRISGTEIFFVTDEKMKERFEKPQPREAINTAFSHALGRQVSVHFVTATGGPPAEAALTAENHLKELVGVAEERGGVVHR